MAKKSVSVLESAAYVDRAVTALRRLLVRLAARDAATRRRCERIAAAGAGSRRPARKVAKKSTSPSVTISREVEAPVQTTTLQAAPEPIAVPAPEPIAPATPATTPEPVATPAPAPSPHRHVPSLPRRPVVYGPWLEQWQRRQNRSATLA